jgi:hypothetical protein
LFSFHVPVSPARNNVADVLVNYTKQFGQGPMRVPTRYLVASGGGVFDGGIVVAAFDE